MPQSIEWPRLMGVFVLAASAVIAAAGCEGVLGSDEVLFLLRDGATTDAPFCPPSLPDAFAGAWRPPRSPSEACSPQELEAYYAACFSTGATKATCTAFENDSVHASCAGCMITDADAPGLGPVVRWPNQTLQPDVAGCLALVDGDSGPSGCAAAFFAQQQCEYAACAFCSGQTFMDACTAAADVGPCKAVVQNAACATAPRYDPCFFVGFSQYFYGLGLRFCVASGDASTDGNGPGDADASPE